MSERFFVPSPIASRFVSLENQEAHHLIHVMRAKAGDEVVLFDGTGVEFSAHVATVGRGRVELEVTQRVEIDREAARELTMAVALPKGDRQTWLVEKAVELGVQRLIPIETERSIVKYSDNTLNRLRRRVVESSKQCGRNRLMEISPAKSFNTLIGDLSEQFPRAIATPTGSMTASQWIGSLDNRYPQRPVYVTVGPEGGFTEKEIRVANCNGWESITLGERTLRVETAVVALAALLSCG